MRFKFLFNGFIVLDCKITNFPFITDTYLYQISIEMLQYEDFYFLYYHSIQKLRKLSKNKNYAALLWSCIANKNTNLNILHIDMLLTSSLVDNQALVVLAHLLASSINKLSVGGIQNLYLLYAGIIRDYTGNLLD